MLPSPWGWVAVVVAALDRRRRDGRASSGGRSGGRAAVGAETLVGRRAVVVRALAPRGQVKLDGELWEARATRDDSSRVREVVVTGRRRARARRRGACTDRCKRRDDAQADARVRRHRVPRLGAPARARGPSRASLREALDARLPRLGRARRRRADRRRRPRDRAGREPRRPRAARRSSGSPRRSTPRSRTTSRSLAADEAPDGFHARFSATGRSYRYVVLDEPRPRAARARRALWWPRPRRRGRRSPACAAALVGEHDFTAFTPTETHHEVFRRDDPRARPGSGAATSSTSRSPPTRSSGTWCGRWSGRCSSTDAEALERLLDGPPARGGRDDRAAVGALPRARRLPSRRSAEAAARAPWLRSTACATPSSSSTSTGR